MQVMQIGELIETTWTIEFTESEAPADPPIVMLLVRKPDGTEVKSVYGIVDQPYTITRVGAGMYRALVPINAIGRRWALRWNAYDENGSPVAADERGIFTQATDFAQPLPTV